MTNSQKPVHVQSNNKDTCEQVLTHLFLIHPFPNPCKYQKCFQGVGKRCIGNEWVTIVNFEEVNIQAKNYVFHLVILEKPSKPMKIFWVPEKSTKKFFAWNIYPLYDNEAKKYWKIFFEILWLWRSRFIEDDKSQWPQESLNCMTAKSICMHTLNPLSHNTED